MSTPGLSAGWRCAPRWCERGGATSAALGSEVTPASGWRCSLSALGTGTSTGSLAPWMSLRSSSAACAAAATALSTCVGMENCVAVGSDSG
eukprot:1554918-Lingulodinium_polyedra.AAC.2